MKFCLTVLDREIRIWKTDFGNMARAGIFSHEDARLFQFL